MIEKGLIITGSDAELLSRALSDVKTKAYEESEAQLDDTQALNALVSGFMSAARDGQEEEKRHSYISPLRKRLVLGTVIEKPGEAANFLAPITTGNMTARKFVKREMKLERSTSQRSKFSV